MRGRQRDRDARGCCCSPTRRCTPTAWPTRPGRSGATTCATSPARSTASSTSRCGCTAARRWPGSSPTRRATTPTAASSAATTCSCWRSGCRSSPPSWTRRMGPRLRRAHGGLRARGRHVARRRGHAAGVQPRHAQPRRAPTSTACPCPTCTSTTTPTTSRCASTPTRRASRSTTRSTPSRVNRVTPYPSTHNLGTCRMSARPADGVVNEFGRAHDVPNLFVSDGSVVHDRRRGQPDADDRRAGDPPGRAHGRRDEGGRPVTLALVHTCVRVRRHRRVGALLRGCWASSAAASSTSGRPSTSTWACPATATGSS